jgi:hypothetical protein
VRPGRLKRCFHARCNALRGWRRLRPTSRQGTALARSDRGRAERTAGGDQQRAPLPEGARASERADGRGRRGRRWWRSYTARRGTRPGPRRCRAGARRAIESPAPGLRRRITSRGCGSSGLAIRGDKARSVRRTQVGRRSGVRAALLGFAMSWNNLLRRTVSALSAVIVS